MFLAGLPLTHTLESPTGAPDRLVVVVVVVVIVVVVVVVGLAYSGVSSGKKNQLFRKNIFTILTGCDMFIVGHR